MIIAIESSVPTFKPVRFRQGLNVLLADTRPDATRGQTRNSAGKTSLLEIIHFLLGANADADSLMRTDQLSAHTFFGKFRIGANTIDVARTGGDPSKIFLLHGSADLVRVPVKVDKQSGREYVSNNAWRDFLGSEYFGLPLEPEGSIYAEPFAPSFRSLVSYFARRVGSGGFSRPELHSQAQQRGDYQVNLSYLFGLDWQIASGFEKIRNRERMLREVRRAARQGAFGDLLGTVAELRPQVTLASASAQKLREQLSRFEVLDSYKDLTRRAARAKSELQRVGEELVSFNENLEYLERALEAEKPPGKRDLEMLYSEVGIQLPGTALRRFDEVSRFYESVIANRRSHLQTEITELKGKISECDRRMAELDRERSGILQTLRGRGALEDFVALQNELATAEATAATLQERFKAAEILEGEGTQLEIDRANLKRRLQEDLKQRTAALDEAIIVVARIIAELYDDRKGSFVVEATDNGPEFRISIEGDRGGGISNMEIFCFDLALLELTTKKHRGPGFLIHDSHLFDGVDERQIAEAIQLGKDAAESLSVQYIVTMNSDVFNRLPFSGIDRDAVVLPVRLSDETETGGLFGFRF